MCENLNKCRVQEIICVKTSKNMEHDNLLRVTRRFKRIQDFHFWRWRFCLSQNFSHSSMVGWIERFAKGNKLFFDYNNGPPSLGTISSWSFGLHLVFVPNYVRLSKPWSQPCTFTCSHLQHLNLCQKPIVQQLKTLNCQNPIVAIVAIEPINYLLFGFTNVIVVDHIFPRLSLNPSMLWCFYRMSKS